MSKESTSSGSIFGSLGFAIAAGLSYAKWGGFWLAFGHAILGWIYVIYYLVKYGIHLG